jgi:F0F1-type ATP synthase assembly protein I
MDLALALLVFLLLGWAIDNWFGTKPIFIILFAVLALIGGGARIKYAYDESMERHERERAEAMRATARTNAETRP